MPSIIKYGLSEIIYYISYYIPDILVVNIKKHKI